VVLGKKGPPPPKRNQKTREQERRKIFNKELIRRDPTKTSIETRDPNGRSSKGGRRVLLGEISAKKRGGRRRGRLEGRGGLDGEERDSGAASGKSWSRPQGPTPLSKSRGARGEELCGG